jgi:oligosaccharide repeat unit polymerase
MEKGTRMSQARAHTKGVHAPLSGGVRTYTNHLFVNAGILTIPFAAALALLLLPSDPSSEGALFFSAWILTVGIVAAIVADCADRGIEVIFRAEHILMVAIIIVVYPELLQYSYQQSLEAEDISKGFVAIGLFATMLAAGSCIKPRPLPAVVVDLARRNYSKDMVFKILLACWALAMLNYLIAVDFSLSAILDGLLASRFASPWQRGQFGGWDAFRDFLTNFGLILPTLTVILALQEGSWARFRVMVGLVCSVINIAFVAQAGGRRVLVATVGAAALTWLCAKRKQLRPEYYLYIVILAIVAVLLLEIILSRRNEGYRDFSYEQSNFEGVHVDDNFTTLSQTLRVIPAETDFVGFQYLVFVAVRPIPRLLWSNKPVNVGFDLAQHLGKRGVALALSIVGEAYMSFGWLGIALCGLLFGWLARMWSQLLENDYGVVGVAIYGMGTMALFIGVRSLLELVLMSYPLVCWFALDGIVWKWVGRKSERALKAGSMSPVRLRL